MILIIAAANAFMCPVQAGVDMEISGTAIIDTQPPYFVVDQIPEFTIFQGGDIVPFHWISGDHHPGTVPAYFTATVWIEGQADSTINYFPDTAEFTWEWTVPEVTSGEVHLEVLAKDAFGNAAAGTTNNFIVLSSVTNVPRSPGKLSLAAPSPNPFNPSTRLGFSLPEPGRVDLTVYDARGHRIRTLLRDHRQGGDFEAWWDGRDGRGRTTSGGVYLFVLDFHGSHETGRVSRKAVFIP